MSQGYFILDTVIHIPNKRGKCRNGHNIARGKYALSVLMLDYDGRLKKFELCEKCAIIFMKDKIGLMQKKLLALEEGTHG